MADDDPVIFNRRSAELIRQAVRSELARVKNDLLRETIGDARRSGRLQPFVNVSGETIPAHAICAVTTGSTYIVTALTNYVQLSKPSTIFTRVYAAAYGEDTTNLGSGLCYLSGPAAILYDSTATASFGDGYGPQPDSFRLKKGFPKTTTVLGIVSSTTHIFYGSLDQINTLVGKASGAITARSGTTPGTGTMAIWANISGTLTDTTMSVTAKNLSATAVTASAYIMAKWVGNDWFVDFEDCS